MLGAVLRDRWYVVRLPRYDLVFQCNGIGRPPRGKIWAKMTEKASGPIPTNYAPLTPADMVVATAKGILGVSPPGTGADPPRVRRTAGALLDSAFPAPGGIKTAGAWSHPAWIRVGDRRLERKRTKGVGGRPWSRDARLPLRPAWSRPVRFEILLSSRAPPCSASRPGDPPVPPRPYGIPAGWVAAGIEKEAAA